MTTKTRPPASTKIATCYNPNATTRHVVVEIRHENRKGDPKPYTVARIFRGVGEGYTRHATEDEAIAEAASFGFTDVVRA